MKANTQMENDHKKPPRAAWFATFTLLDVGGAISSSQLQRMLAPVKKLWRRAIGHAA
jgi:hypothetical protein